MISTELRKRIIRISIPIAFVAAILLLFSLLAPWLSPADSVAHFRHYLLLSLVPLLIVHAVSGHQRVALVSGLVAVAGAYSMPQLFASASTSGNANLEVVQANLRYNNADVQDLATVIANADLVMLQEVSSYNESSIATITAEFPSRQRCPLTDLMHVLVLSRHASSASGCDEGLAWMTLSVDGRELTAVSIHLLWPWPFGQRDQLDKLRPTISELPQPAIVGGDFNAAPWSATVADVARWSATRITPGLRSTFDLKLPYVGVGLKLPIDHILVAESLQVISMDVLDSIGSDHRPIRARISFPK